MFKKILSIALAYVGIIVGAGLSSGQDLMQYFIGFGIMGIVGVVLLGFLNAVFGRIIVGMGSYYRSSDHSEVLSEIAHPITNKILDFSLIVSCFVIGFVMIAGAGANLQQQFGFPSWVGALICSLLVILVSFLDFEKITNVIGIFTPIVFVLIGVIAAKTFMGQSYDISFLDQTARQIDTTMPNVWLSVINYFALCVMTGVSMAFVLGGSIMRIGVAEKGGALGGALVGLILFLVSTILFARIDLIAQDEIPMLTLANDVHPLFGQFYALIIFGLIFNTAFSLYYALTKRFAGQDPKKASKLIILFTAVGFALSFLGFKSLIGMMYPILGYLGILMLLVLLFAWIKDKAKIQDEKLRRKQVIQLITKKLDPRKVFTKKDKQKVKNLVEESVIDNKELTKDVHELVEEELDLPDTH